MVPDNTLSRPIKTQVILSCFGVTTCFGSGVQVVSPIHFLEILDLKSKIDIFFTLIPRADVSPCDLYKINHVAYHHLISSCCSQGSSGVFTGASGTPITAWPLIIILNLIRTLTLGPKVLTNLFRAVTRNWTIGSAFLMQYIYQRIQQRFFKVARNMVHDCGLVNGDFW